MPKWVADAKIKKKKQEQKTTPKKSTTRLSDAQYQKMYGRPRKTTTPAKKVESVSKRSTFLGGGSAVRKVEENRRTSNTRTVSTERQSSSSTRRTTMTDAQYQKTYGQPRNTTVKRQPIAKTASERAAAARQQKITGGIDNSAKARQEREDRRREAQRQKMGLNSQATPAQRRAAERAIRNTPELMKKAGLDAASGYGQTLTDVIARTASNENGVKAKAMKMGIEEGTKQYKELEEERKRTAEEARKDNESLYQKMQERQAAWDEKTKNAKGFEKAYYGAVESGTGMVADTAIGLLTGTGQVGALASMGLRTYGSSANQARAEGATDAEAGWYGLGQAVKEMGTEMIGGGGLAKAAYGKGALSLGDIATNTLIRNLKGQTADLAHMGIRLFSDVAEENIEELAGWALDPWIKELTYGRNVRDREGQSAKSAMRERSDALRAEIQSEDDARAAAAYISSDDFVEQTKQQYIAAGMKEKEAEETAERMRDYLTASLTGDTDSMEKIEDDVYKKVAGSHSVWSDYSFRELKETFEATTLLVGTTGIGGNISTMNRGNLVKDQLGEEGVRALANTAIDFEDAQMSTKAKAMKARMDEGKELTGTQVYELQAGMQEQVRRDTEREQSSRSLAARTIESDNLLTPYRQNENGGLDLDEVTENTYRENANRAGAAIDALTKESKESITDTQKVDGSKAIAGFQTGVFTVDDANALNYSNTTVRAAFEAVTGVNLGQYIVRKKNGEVDIPATNTKTKDALFAMAADNLVKSAQAETANWMDNAKGQVVTQVTARMGARGSEVLQMALDGVDERDRSKYMMTANATDMLYQAARNMGTEWESISTEATRMFPGISESKLKAMYEAGLEDRDMANDKARGRQIRMGEALSEMGEQETATGKVYIDSEVPLKGSVIRTFTEIAKNLGADIHFVDYIYDANNDPIEGANGSYDPNTNTFYLNVSTGAETNIGYIFMHETTHYLKRFAPEQYQALENLVRERWFAFNPSQMQDAIARKIEAYKRVTKGQQVLTEEQALEEIIADASHDFINDPEFAQQVAEEDMGLAKAVLDSIRNALRMLRRIFASGSVDDDTHMNSLFRELDILTEAERLWLDAYKVAVRNSSLAAVNTWQDEVNAESRKSIDEGKNHIRSYSTAAYSGQVNMRSDYKMGDNVLGYVDWTIYNDKPSISYIEVDKDYRRQGIARKLLQSIQRQYPNTEIDFGMTTEDGTALVDSITYDVEDEDTKNKLESLESKRAEIADLEKKLNSDEITDEEAQSYGDQWDKLNDEIRTLESETEGQKPVQKFVRFSINETDNEGKSLSEDQRTFFRYVAPELKDENGNLKRFYHGTGRADRVGYYFDPERATSGPMAYFTDNKDIATNYSQSKQDTSLAYESDDIHNYHNQFVVDVDGEEVRLEDYWHMLPASKRNEFKERAGHITRDWDTYELTYDENVTNGNGGYGNDPYLVRKARGNAFTMLIDAWLDSGDFFGEEEKFLEVMDLLGMEGVKYKDPDYREEKVYEVYLNVTNPLVTSYIDDEFVADVKDWVNATDLDFYAKESAQADMWDKNSVDPYDWIERLESDVENDTTHAWTSIPDVITDFLKEQGYDGIVDKGGKGGGIGHQVVIPFSSEQIKDINNEHPTKENPDIRYSITPEMDADYMAAINSGNMEEAQRLVNEAAESSGYTTKAYHGTIYNFTEFDVERSGRNYQGYSKYGQGLYFSDSEEVADRWSKKGHVVNAFLKLNNPFNPNATVTEGKLLDEYNKLRRKDKALVKMFKERGKPFDRTSENGTALIQTLNELSKDRGYSTRLLAELGYDGIKAQHYTAEEGNRTFWAGSTEYVVFDPAQVKSADTITYREDGSVIPLSERFDSSNNDIRYSLSTIDSDGNILTDGQMDYFRNSQARDADGHMQVVYHTTNNGGFTVFDPAYSDDRRSLFFASNFAVSQTYGHRANRPITLESTHVVDYKSFDEFEKDALKRFYARDLSQVANFQVKPKQWVVDNPPEDYEPDISIFRYKGLAQRNDPKADYYYVDYHLSGPLEGREINAWGTAWDYETLLAKLSEEMSITPREQRGYYSCYLNLENPLIVDAKGANWNRISYDPYGNETAGITVQDAIEQIESADIADYGIKNIDVEFEYNDDGFPIAVSYDIGLLGIPDEEHWEWTNYVESDSFEPNVEEYTDNGVLDNAELGIAMWTWVEDKLRNYVSDGMIDMMEQTNIDVNGELHYESFNKTGYDFIRGGNIVDVSEFTDNIDDASGKEYTVNTRDLAEIAENYGHDGVIIRNIMDIGGSSSLKGGQALSDIFIAFSSNQVKDTRNENPTDDPDIRYSITPEDDAMEWLASQYDLEDVPLEDPKAEEGRVRMAKSKQDFVKSRNALWNERWLTEGKVLDVKSVRKNIKELVTGAMMNSDTSRQYKNDLVDKILTDAKSAFWLMKEGKYSEAGELIWDSAVKMIENVDFIEDETFNNYKDLRDYMRTTSFRLGEEYWSDVDFSAFRKRNFGKIKLVKGETNIDEIYQELQERWPEWFDEEEQMTAPDQLLHIEEVLDAIQPYKIAYSSEEAEQLAGDIASDLYDIIYEGKEYKSIADSYKEKYDAKTKALKERHQEALRKVREEGDLRLRKEKAKFKEYKEKKKSAKEKAKHFGRIAANIDWLTDRLLNETKDKNIPEGFRKSLAHMLMQFDMQTERSKALEQKYGVAKKTLQMRELQKRLEQIAKEDDTGEFRYDGYLFYLMDALAEKVDGKSIDSLDTEDLIVIDTMLRSIKHNFSNYNKVRLEEEQVAIANIGDNTISAMEERIKKFGKRKNRTGTLGLFDKLVNEGEQTPIYLFERLDPAGNGIGAMYKELRRGEDHHIRNMNFLRNRFQSMFQDYFNKAKPGSELESWRDDSQAQTFSLENGSITLNPAQIMSLYCLSKRTQAMGHILGSGIVASPVNVGQKLRDQFKGKDEQVNSVRITYSEIQDIITKLTPEQMKLADEMQSLLNNEMAAWGNETSLEMHGIKLFREKDYFPIKSSGESLAKTADSFDVQEKIKNFGFTKPLVRNANNAIMIDDIFSVVADHCNKMSLYNSMAIPISDFMRVYNYKQRREDGTVKTSVQAMIGDAFTRKVNDYIMKFIGDVNGNTKTRSDAVNDLMNKALANYKKASIGANFRVALQQPTAIFRSLMAIDAKYFVGINPVSPSEVKEMFEHCPIALWKSWGHYDMDMGRDIEDIMMNNDWSRWDTVTMGLYGSLDNWTWSLIWQAVKKEVKAKNPDVKVGSDEFFKLCNERASEVFDKTQVVDSIFHRSDTMRSKNTLTKMATSFMAEPTLTFNVFRDSLVNANEMWKDGDKTGAAITFNKMGLVLCLNAAAVSAAAAIWDAIRGKGGDDDDDEEGFIELWLANFKQNFLDNAPWAQWNNIYFVKDIISLKDGWGTSNMALEGFETIFKGMEQLKKKINEGSDKSWYDIFMNLFGGVGYVTGVPVKTIMRDVKAVFKKFGIDVFAADGTEEEESLIDSIANKIGYRPIQRNGNGDAKIHDSFLSRLGIGKTEEEKEQDAFDKKAEEIAGKTADLSGEARDKKVWSYVTTYMKSQNGDKPLADVIQEGDYRTVDKYRQMYVAAGGDTEYFDGRIFETSKSAMKKTIVYDPTDEQIEAQENIKDYLLNHGMTDAELSDMVYKSDTAKDMKVAFRINDKDAMLETLEPLVRAGLSYEDLERLWENRNRMQITSYKGRYKDRLKSTGKFIWPTDGQITSYFGYRNAPTAGASSNHPAIDIGAPMGSDVVAADGGVVIYVGQNGGYGKSVGIKHDNGMVTYYNHLSAWNVHEGDTVAQGQLIANVGSTGISTGPHLDFKILDADGEPVDPLKYLSSRS